MIWVVTEDSNSARDLGYGFLFSKKGRHSSKSICWTMDCTIIQKDMPVQQKEKECEIKCAYCCKDKTAKEKFLDLEANSMMKYYDEKFEDLFK